MPQALDQLRSLAREKALVSSAAATIGWDQETYLPEHGHTWRASQLAWLAAKAHELATSPAWQNALEALETENSHPALAQALRREFDKATRLPSELVAQEAEATSLAKQAWADARQRSDFNSFAPHLQTILDLSRKKADLWGFNAEPYDALVDTYERGATAAQIETLFSTLGPQLREIAAAAVNHSAQNPVKLPSGPYPIESQKVLNAQVAAALGFDFNAGRIDTTAHPFCTTLGPRDIRLTTRYDENDFTSSLFGVMHEAGHGLYEQGLLESEFGLPSGEAASLGIHESQSRLWENHVGRSRTFWETWFPIAANLFPQLQTIDLDDFLKIVHRAKRSFIRVEADEATYDLHIILRFRIERQLLQGSLKVAEVPDAWNAAFHDFFAMTPPDHRHGCLQDIHWSMGGLGYFPTYTLGNLNAAQLFAAAHRENTIATATAKADYLPLLQWLRTHIHQHGALLTPSELITRCTGEAPSAQAHLAHLRHRYLP